MKRLFALASAALIGLSLTACGGPAQPSSTASAVPVAAQNSEPAPAAKSVAPEPATPDVPAESVNKDKLEGRWEFKNAYTVGFGTPDSVKKLDIQVMGLRFKGDAVNVFVVMTGGLAGYFDVEYGMDYTFAGDETINFTNSNGAQMFVQIKKKWVPLTGVVAFSGKTMTIALEDGTMLKATQPDS
ncbi:MAG: hypothetical protein LBR58_03185 [Propionibacteriaceae bacterium]|jgi:hypothetical protein|nr:hypothetical protein [Propionibacteriaceae bacterium]